MIEVSRLISLRRAKVKKANALRKFKENEFFDSNNRIIYKLNTTSDHIFFLITTLLLIALVLGTFVQTLNFILNSLYIILLNFPKLFLVQLIKLRCDQIHDFLQTLNLIQTIL